MYDRWLQNGTSNCLIVFCSKRYSLSQIKNDEEHINQNSYDREDIEKNNDVSLIHRILLGLYRFIHKFAWPLLVFFSAATCISAVFGSKIPQPENNLVRLLPSNNEYEQFHQASDFYLSISSAVLLLLTQILLFSGLQDY
jgi:hypothetical protein